VVRVDFWFLVFPSLEKPTSLEKPCFATHALARPYQKDLDS